MTIEELERRAIAEDRLSGFVSDYARLCRIEVDHGEAIRAPGEDGLGAQKAAHHDEQTRRHLLSEAARAEQSLVFAPSHVPIRVDPFEDLSALDAARVRVLRASGERPR